MLITRYCEHLPCDNPRDAFARDVSVMVGVDVDITGIHIFEHVSYEMEIVSFNRLVNSNG